MENSYQNKRSRKFLRVCKLLSIIYQELQLYSETSQWTQRKEEIEMGIRIPESIWRVKRQNYKSTSTFSLKKRRKIQSRNRCFKICNQRSLITRTRKKIEIYYFSIKDNVSRMKKVDLTFFYFPFSFLFSFWFIFFYSIFRTRVRARMTRLHCHTAGHIRWHDHKSHDA